ncbi:MAG TPA: hypothetical protein VF733_05895 [Candidatus Saccharimonadales bacterium]
MKYFLGFLVSIGLIILVFILILRGFSGKKTDEIPKPLVDYANTSTLVRMTVDGSIISDQEHRSYRITVGKDATEIETLQGYQNLPLESKTFDNNQEGYANFLRAIDLAGFAKGNSKSQNKDERGVCPNGSRVIFEILDNASRKQRFWTTTCGGGTFKGNAPSVRQLFNRQVPNADFSKLTGRLRLSN